MNHPGTLAIGPLVYAVVSDEAAYLRAVADDKVDIYGSINYGDLRIVLSPRQAAAHQRTALWHEVIHAALHLTDPDLSDEERCVRALAMPLLDVLRRNPALVAYLTAADGGDAAQ